MLIHFIAATEAYIKPLEKALKNQIGHKSRNIKNIHIVEDENKTSIHTMDMRKTTHLITYAILEGILECPLLVLNNYGLEEDPLLFFDGENTFLGVTPDNTLYFVSARPGSDSIGLYQIKAECDFNIFQNKELLHHKRPFWCETVRKKSPFIGLYFKDGSSIYVPL